MTDTKKKGKAKKLQLHKETLQDLGAKDGVIKGGRGDPIGTVAPAYTCASACLQSGCNGLCARIGRA